MLRQNFSRSTPSVVITTVTPEEESFSLRVIRALWTLRRALRPRGRIGEPILAHHTPLGDLRNLLTERLTNMCVPRSAEPQPHSRRRASAQSSSPPPTRGRNLCTRWAPVGQDDAHVFYGFDINERAAPSSSATFRYSAAKARKAVSRLGAFVRPFDPTHS